jgi:hypothetical protein
MIRVITDKSITVILWASLTNITDKVMTDKVITDKVITDKVITDKVITFILWAWLTNKLAGYLKRNEQLQMMEDKRLSRNY